MSPTSAMLLRLEHGRLSQGNGEETIERRYRQYLRIEPQMRLRKNASFVLRGYAIEDEIGGGHTRSHQGGSYDSRRRTENERQTHSILDQVGPKTQIRNAESVRHTAVRELNLTGSQLVVGCMCFLGAIRLVLWAVLKLWLFEP